MRRLGIIVLVVLAAVGQGCSTNPSTGRNQWILISSEEVAAMGVEAMPQLVAEYGGEVQSRQLREYVDEVGHRLAATVEPEFRDVEWEFTVLDSDVINAFALPGGKVFISRGLLRQFENEAQVAGVLGHEIGHVTARHIDERISHALITQYGLETVGILSESDLIVAGAGTLVNLGSLKFSRFQESESDHQGLKYMTAAGYDPSGMLEVLHVLLEASGRGGPPEILSTHPHPESRLEEVEMLLDTEYRYTQGNPEYRKYVGRFQREAIPHLQ